MPDGEKIGGVYVTIAGDNGPLLLEFSKTDAAAKAAAQQIAASFNTASVSAQDLGFATGQIVGAIEKLAVTVQEEGAAATLAAQRNLEMAGSLTAVGAAAGSAQRGLNGATSSARMLGSELRVLSGTGGLLAAERFLTMLPGVAAAASFALPLIGLIAVVELAAHGIEKFTGLSEAEKKADENVVRLTKDTHSLIEEIAKIDTDTFRKLYGPTLTLGARQIPALMEQIVAQETLIDSTRRMIAADAEMRKQREAAVTANPDLGPGFIPAPDKALPKLLVDQETALDKMKSQLHAFNVDLGQSQQDDNKKSDELEKKQTEDGKHRATERIEEIRKEAENLKSAFALQLADLKASHQLTTADEIAFWSARLTLVGQWGGRYSDLKRELSQTIGNLDQQNDRQRAEQAKIAREAQIRDLEETGREADEQIRRNAESARAAYEAAARESSLRQRTGQLATQTQGVRPEAENENEKLLLQQQYALQIVHTKAQEIAYTRELAALEEKALQLKISIAEQELFQAVAEQNILPTREGELKIAEDSLRLAQAKAALLKQETEDRTKIMELEQKQTLGSQIIGKVGKGPGSILDAANVQIANTTAAAVDGISAALGRAVQGGQSFSRIMQQLGRSVLGEVVSGIAKIGLQMATTALVGKAATTAIAATEAAQAAGLGAAWAFASVLAALPFPANVAAAPGIAAAEAAQILAIGIPKYDKGGPIREDQIAMVHKGEYVLTSDQVNGRAVIPSFSGSGAVGSAPFTSTTSVNSASSAFSIGAIHLHGVRDMRDIARRLPDFLKASSSGFQAASR